MNIQKVSKADAEKRLKDHRGWMRGWLVKHAGMVKQEAAIRIGKDFDQDFVKGQAAWGNRLLVSQGKAQAHMDRHSVWITIYKRLLRIFESGEQDTQTVVGGICDGCKQPHLEVTERGGEYYCADCKALPRCQLCRGPNRIGEDCLCPECNALPTCPKCCVPMRDSHKCGECPACGTEGMLIDLQDGRTICTDCFAKR